MWYLGLCSIRDILEIEGVVKLGDCGLQVARGRVTGMIQLEPPPGEWGGPTGDLLQWFSCFGNCSRSNQVYSLQQAKIPWQIIDCWRGEAVKTLMELWEL